MSSRRCAPSSRMCARAATRALIELTRKFDRVDLDKLGLRVSADEIAAAAKSCDARALDALKLARDRIEAYHVRQKPKDDRFTDPLGVELGSRWTAIEAVGLYVPGGTAAYPSSVLMNAVPAKVAGVPRIVMVVPAPDGKLNPLVLAAAQLAGVDEIYRIGGAQAVAALAYGTRHDQAGGQDRRSRQCLCGRRQAAGVRHGRHRHDRRPLRSAGHRRQDRQSRLDRRRSAGAGRARRQRAIDPDHRQCRACRRRSKKRSPRSSRRCRAPRSPARRGAISAPSSWSATLDEAVALTDALAPEHLEIDRRRTPSAGRQNPQCRRDLHRRAHAGSDRRLRRRLEPRPADRALGALLVRARRARFHEAHVDPQMRARAACARLAAPPSRSARPKACRRTPARCRSVSTK